MQVVGNADLTDGQDGVHDVLAGVPCVEQSIDSCFGRLTALKGSFVIAAASDYF